MGRWGFRMFLEMIPPHMSITNLLGEPLGVFQGDLDLETCADFETMVVNFLKDERVGPQILVTPAMRETGQKIIDSAEEQNNGGSGASYLLDNIKRGDPAIREILDHAVCFTALDLAKGDEFAEIIIGALMMQAGAKLRPKDKRRLRKILAVFPEGDDELPENGFSNAGQAQFSAALDHYRAGTPRDFQCPRSVVVDHVYFSPSVPLLTNK